MVGNRAPGGRRALGEGFTCVKCVNICDYEIKNTQKGVLLLYPEKGSDLSRSERRVSFVLWANKGCPFDMGLFGNPLITHVDIGFNICEFPGRGAFHQMRRPPR